MTQSPRVNLFLAAMAMGGMAPPLPAGPLRGYRTRNSDEDPKAKRKRKQARKDRKRNARRGR